MAILFFFANFVSKNRQYFRNLEIYCFKPEIKIVETRDRLIIDRTVRLTVNPRDKTSQIAITKSLNPIIPDKCGKKL